MLQSIDTSSQVNADKVIAKVRGKQRGGIPWMTIVDANGKRLITSDGPKGNIGCPIQPPETEYFRTMLEKTRKKLTDAELDALKKANDTYAERYRRPAKKPRDR